ncbi:hypothetical protein [Streptomyces sp. YGL11-2]|uniref:hypothetical protein n=1 Tax=Streptomyces sp. YGL11-2 TaxID=3414028 RepID=UPI003CEEE158
MANAPLFIAARPVIHGWPTPRPFRGLRAQGERPGTVDHRTVTTWDKAAEAAITAAHLKASMQALDEG